MEMVTQYNKANKIDRLHYITVESIINRITDAYRGKPKNLENMGKIAHELQLEMKTRRLDKYFQLELCLSKVTTLGIKVHEVNAFNRPKECVIWN